MQAMMLQPIIANSFDASNYCILVALKAENAIIFILQQKCVNICINLDADIKILMQSKYDGKDISATLPLPPTLLLKLSKGLLPFMLLCTYFVGKSFSYSEEKEKCPKENSLEYVQK